MNVVGMNPGNMAGGPVGGGMIMMNNGSPATQITSITSPEQVKAQLNTYIYEYLLKLGHFEIARSLLHEDKFEIRTKPPVKQSPGRRKDAEVNGVGGDAMDTDVKDDIPDDLPRPMHVGDSPQPGHGFLFEWFSIFSDLFAAHQRSSKVQGAQGTAMGPAAQYLIQHQNMQRMRENQQNQNLARPGMMNPSQFAMRNMRNNIMNGNIPRDLANKMTPQQLQHMNKQAQMMQQQQLQRDQGDLDMNGRASSPAEGENGGSPSKRPRLEGQQFNGGMMPNVRPGMPNVAAPQNMMIQNAFNPNMNNAQFRQNGAMAQKPMPGAMPNGMMAMANAGSPMMQGMNPAQFGDNMSIEMYNQRLAGQQMQGTPANGQSGNHALQDYQMQLMLLEQQNKKRLMMARQEQDNAVNRDGAPMVGMQPGGMSPSSRTGTSPNPADQVKRTPQLGGLPGSPSAAEAMAGRSPAGMNFMNGMPGGDFNAAMFMKDNQGMVGPGGPNMRPPTSVDMSAMVRQQQQAQNRMPGQFPGGQPMVQQPSQGQPQPMGTPGQRNEMPPPQAPTGNSAQRNQPASPQTNNAPPTPSTTNKPNPKKKSKEDSNKKRPAKKASTANAPSSENEPPATPTPSTPITPVHPQGFAANKGAGPGLPNANQAAPPAQVLPPSQPPMPQPDLSQSNAFADFNGPDQNFNLDFSTLENSDVLENFDFDSFLNTSTDDAFNFDGGIGVGGDFGLDAAE